MTVQGGTVTRIEPQKRPGRVNIYLDGEFAFGISADLLVDFSIARGDELSGEQVGRIRAAEETERAKAKARSLLSYRARSSEEIRLRLSREGFSNNAVERTVEDFTRAGLLDDTAFAGAWARTRMAGRPAAKGLLIRELESLGIDAQTAAAAVEGAYSGITEEAVAAALIRAKEKRYRTRDAATEKKLFDYLRRRGFSWSLIRRAVETYWKDPE